MSPVHPTQRPGPPIASSGKRRVEVSSIVRSAAPVAATGATRIETITDSAGFHAMREEWAELLESSTSDCVFLTWEWLHTWWKHLGAGRQLDQAG